MVRPAPAVADGSLYADWMSAGNSPDGVAAAGVTPAGAAAGSSRSAMHDAPVTTWAQTRFACLPADCADEAGAAPATGATTPAQASEARPAAATAARTGRTLTDTS
jgi:hypothetical protein